MPVQFSLPLRWVQAGQTFPSYLKMLRNPPTTAAFVVPAAARRCLLPLLLLFFVPLVVIATLLLLFAINRLLCDLLLVSSRCVVCVYAWLRAWIILGFLGLWNRIWCMSVGFSLSVSPVFGLRLCRAC